MEWYLGSEVDDLVVPRDQGSMGGRISSPDNWSQWGITGFGEHSKKNFIAETNTNFSRGGGGGQGFIFNGKNYNNSVQERDDSANRCQELLYSGWPHDEDQARIDRMDDIFFNSLLEEDVTGANNPNGGSSRYSLESHYDMIPADNMFNDLMSEQQYIPRTSPSMDCENAKISRNCRVGTSNYLEKHAFSPSMDWENAADSSTCPGKQDTLNRNSEKETSLEESVLLELKRVTSQFTKKMRICCRDSLYRLAKNSKPPASFSQDGDIIMDEQPIMKSGGETSRIGEMEATELKTNPIDRAIASLMFSKMNFVDEEEETIEQQPNYGVTQHRISYCPQLARLVGDAEVPNVGQATNV